MQQLQSTFLNKIILGKTPLFIIAPEHIEGAVVAALLSNYIKIKDMLEFAHSVAGYEHNYFNNSEVSRVIQGFKDKGYSKVEESKATLRFLLEIGFDNNKLWGLACTYEAFLSYSCIRYSLTRSLLLYITRKL